MSRPPRPVWVKIRAQRSRTRQLARQGRCRLDCRSPICCGDRSGRCAPGRLPPQQWSGSAPVSWLSDRLEPEPDRPLGEYLPGRGRGGLEIMAHLVAIEREVGALAVRGDRHDG